MTEADSRSARVEDHEELQRDAQAPEGSRRLEVLFGGGGDPLVFGLPVFVSGSLVLGFALIGMVHVPDSLGAVLPETTFATGLGEFVTALWAIGLGQTMVAAIFGLFAAFWFSLFALLMGTVIHASWFNVLPADATATLQMFFIAWLIVFVFLTLGILRLPLSYILVMVFVDIAVLFVLLAVSSGVQLFFVIGGIAVLAFCAVGLYAFLNTAWVSTGAKRAWPPLGPPILK
ncbi:MAG: GPR1/FUN34/YaaH family transporter [Pseudonocardia sp.]|nr:GPR1/FUN34/YaaH family transporter [Pseudonocardia sp.]